VDFQAHGVIHNFPMGPDSSDEFIYGELQGSIDKFQEYFGKQPTAIIWPGGGFAERPAEIARELGYRLGFTVNPRGPLMYNWVPLTDVKDERRPSWLPEGQVNDPLMVLPRYWDTDAILHLQDVIQLSEEAAAHSEANKATELEYYDILCAPTYGPIP
jgi:peptidoglycan/xylan/chitin deacetylase (PgdA/CDA1 family)